MNTIKNINYVYSRFLPDMGDEHWIEHRIIKETEKFLFVAWLGRADTIIKLRSDELMANGYVWHKKTFSRYYSHLGKMNFDKEHEYILPIPECLHVFGLNHNATKADLNQAFRKLAKKHHPDTGGEKVAFQHLQEQYNDALKYVMG